MPRDTELNLGVNDMAAFSNPWAKTKLVISILVILTVITLVV